MSIAGLSDEYRPLITPLEWRYHQNKAAADVVWIVSTPEISYCDEIIYVYVSRAADFPSASKVPEQMRNSTLFTPIYGDEFSWRKSIFSCIRRRPISAHVGVFPENEIEVGSLESIQGFPRNGGTWRITSTEIDGFLKQHGIRHQRTNDYTPEQNSMAERANRPIVERARVMLFKAVSTALLSRSPTHGHDVTSEDPGVGRNQIFPTSECAEPKR